MSDTANPFPKSTLTFKGCRTTDEALAKLRPWLAQILADLERRLETDLVTDAPDLDPDALADWLATNREANAATLDDLLATARTFIEANLADSGPVKD